MKCIVFCIDKSKKGEIFILIRSIITKLKDTICLEYQVLSLYIHLIFIITTYLLILINLSLIPFD